MFIVKLLQSAKSPLWCSKFWNKTSRWGSDSLQCNFFEKWNKTLTSWNLLKMSVSVYKRQQHSALEAWHCVNIFTK